MSVENLYRKFKSYVYYDNSALHLRHKLAEYESDLNFNDNLKNFAELIDNINLNTDEIPMYLVDLINNISYLVAPKHFEKDTILKHDSCIMNTFESKKYIVDEFNYIIDAPIEIHMLAFYWVLKYGKELEKVYDKYNYGNILDHSYASIDDTSTNTFKPYFTQYSKWRDNGIKKAQDCYKNKEGSAILMLDITRYYYSVNFDFDKLNIFFQKKLEANEYYNYMALTEIIKLVFETYNKQIQPLVKDVKVSLTALPIGIVISPMFANYYLAEFDKKLVIMTKPLYYGRYVDDIIIVFSEESFSEINNSKSPTYDFVVNNLISNNGILHKNDDGFFISCNIFEGDDGTKLKIQKEKLKLYIFDKIGTPAIIENFMENIRHNSSEFRYLPEESKVISEFNTDAYTMLYNGTHYKLRSIEKFSGDKFGVSKYLAKVILTSKYWNGNKEKLDILVEQIDSFFSGIHCLEYYSLWEKIFSFYVINNRSDKIIAFNKKILSNIDLIKTPNSTGVRNERKLKSFLREYCKLSLVQACSLNLEIVDEIGNEIITSVDCLKLRQTNLINDNYLITPLINYSNGVNNIQNLMTLNLRCSKDKITNSKCNQCQVCDLELNLEKFKYSPRFIHYHELQHYHFFLEAYKFESGYFGNYIEKTEYLFDEFNNDCLRLNKNKKPILTQESQEYIDMLINKIEIPETKKHDRLRVGVASIKVDSSNIERSYLKTPNLSRDRFNSLVKLINYIELTKSDIVVLPEVSVPFAWIGILTQFARKQQKCIVFGIEHMINRNNVALNLLATVLPYKINGYNYSFLKLRLKNHYSPDEARLLKGYRYDLPKNVKMSYDIFHWNGTRFACFNCFELADIYHRSYFRSRVDFLTASEYNRDTNYFSNIVESVSRDVHCYFIQSNSSDFGDSRITKPSQSFEKDLVKLKGGINDQVVVGEIDIKKLREFQYKEYELQKDDKSFKPTPPNFNKNEVEKVLSD